MAATPPATVAMWVLVPLLIALATWYPAALQPQPGLDNSWGAALHIAAHDNIGFGRGLIFTYGPLGFLGIPTLWYSDTGTLAFSYLVLLRVALAAALFAGARRSYGALAGALVAIFIAGASNAAYEVVPFLIFAVWVVDRVRDERQVRALVALGAAFAGIELLLKTSNGIALVVLMAIVSLSARGSRRINSAIALAAGLLAVLVGWTATGQSWADLPAYVHDTGRIISGFAAAMEIEEASAAGQYVAAWVAFALGLGAALQMTADSGALRRRVGIVALWVALCFFQYKEGFVRHDVPHGSVYFVALMGAFLAFDWRPGRRMVGLGLAAAMLALACVADGASLSKIIDPVGNTGRAVEQIGQVVSASKRKQIVAAGRAAIRRERPLDPRTLALVREQTTDIYPYEVAVAWAYGLNWDPLPVFQSYSAYTVGLDQQDAEKLESSGAPQRILRNLEVGIDGRLQAFDEPAATRAMLCRYRQLWATATWQALGRAVNRCEKPVLLETVRAGWGQSIPVPAPPSTNSFVFVRIDGAGIGGLERLWGLLYKPAIRNVALGGAVHRLVEGTASDGLLLRAAPGVDFAPPFNFAPEAPTIALGKVGQSHTIDGPLTFSFYYVSVRTGPSAPPALRRRS